MLSQHSQQVLLGVEDFSVSWLGQEAEETSTPNKICWECDNDESPTGKKNTTIEWVDGGKVGNKNKLFLTRK